MDVLLSVKPKYIDSIISGKKKIEFRKQKFNQKSIDFVLIYASSPVKKIVGYFPITDIIEDRPYNLWKKYSSVSGLNKDEFFKYFYNKDIGYAIIIKNFYCFSPFKDPHKIISNFHPPQSFRYLNLQTKEQTFLDLYYN